MRLARYFPAAMVGLAGFAGQAMMPQPCCAWDSVPESVLAESSDLQDTTYISDNAVITDSAVQPAGFYDSRPRHNTASQLQTETESSNADRPGLFYRGQKLRLPTLPFGRQTSSNDASQRMPQTSGAANTPYGMPRAQAHYHSKVSR